MSTVSRRRIMLATFAAAGLPVLAACGKADGKGGGSATASPAAGGASPGAAAAIKLRTALNGASWDVTVGPAAVRDGLTVLRVAYSPVAGEDHKLGFGQFSGGDTGNLGGFRLLSLANDVMYPVIGGDASPLFDGVKAGEWIELYPVFSALPETINSVEVLLPHSGVVLGVPVVGPGQAGFDLDKALENADADRTAEGTNRIVTSSVVSDGSADTKEDEGVTTVTINGDVTFDSGSATLSAQADAILASVVQQLQRFPSGGSMQVTGHTDDVLDDASNQTLSEQRAKAVADRLGQLTSLNAWQQTVAGKGESQPRVPNDSDENRQANRRVEVVLTPTNPKEGQEAKPTAPPSLAPGQMPTAKGPVGAGKDGVDVQYQGQTIHVWMEKVIRTQGYLVGEVLMRSTADVEFPYGAFNLPRAFKAVDWYQDSFRVDNLTLLKGNTYLPVAGYLVGGEDAKPLADVMRVELKGGGEPLHLPAVWPDTGEDKVVLDLPAGDESESSTPVLTLRLTDIPVEQG
ncbi:Outer membrane porin F precursor [Actinomyces bovis]|uniref:Outer membrane porin F n=1 Tax=Actinomyces bovis TaxID=1658 RepID=A0ABY1VLI5_9ACTO|nr:OmpA family protein [Actinomyces bovis]SPT52969.1 Outer membrane porin F precursor [Actinomyces bovis]VEG55178.1 Outer membrane porin F precursor [Actinomyces israelii]